jgi:c-di-GMP-binding flagellar brake protein YcgR
LRLVSTAGVHTLRTRLEQLDPLSGRLVVSWPADHLRLFALRPGQAIVVEFSQPTDALYTRETLLESASTEEPPRLVLRPTGDWQRVQRRETVRHLIDMRPTRATRALATGEHEPFRALIGDLSAGGIRLATSSDLEVGDLLELTFGTPSGGAELRLRVTVARVAPSADLARGVWDVGCQFVEPSTIEREQIVRFILVQQGAVARAS